MRALNTDGNIGCLEVCPSVVREVGHVGNREGVTWKTGGDEDVSRGEEDISW